MMPSPVGQDTGWFRDGKLRYRRDGMAKVTGSKVFALDLRAQAVDQADAGIVIDEVGARTGARNRALFHMGGINSRRKLTVVVVSPFCRNQPAARDCVGLGFALE